jgi:hypothetical protein
LPTPILNIVPTNGNIQLSWTVPSTNFILQQTMDLKSGTWINATNLPGLNLNNLQNQVVLSATNTSSFFRLMSPGKTVTFNYSSP